MDSRSKNALATLIVGLALNIALGVGKLVAGILSGSASVLSDGVNNLSDAAVSVVSAVAVALAARAADHDHPYGHGRYEYIATFVLGAVIAAVGVELFIGGVERAITPQTVDAGLVVWIALGASIAVKSFMAVFYFVRGGRTHNGAIKAAAVDSVSDVAVTTAVLVCAVIQKSTGANIDGYVSIAVSVVIVVFAVRIIKGVIGRLLGGRPDPELTKDIYGILSQSELAESAHNLVVNDYGETVKIAEVDLVFPSDMSFVDVHAECDRLERAVRDKTGVRLSVHADPLITDDARLVDITKRIEECLDAFGATAHDVDISDDARQVELGIVLPDDKAPVDEIKGLIEAQVRQVVPYEVHIHTDFI